ncbi:hypothetical protein B0H17DRAFT_1198990 [Mycena rosella]|uniref:C2H2-type domain-containing protein n=1 Tax=Mycena rosella TaxID=1033263 RepID=A0AAD7GHD8_MYCRO|nr:hypothetical protein B0H17DRAFT_1198990 [Mycena rosella]
MPHIPSVPTPVACPSCEKSFKTPTALKIHSHVHAPERESLKHRCPVEGCTFKVFQLKRMEAHIESTHSDRPFKCVIPDCGFLTVNSGQLRRHYRDRHHLEPRGRMHDSQQRSSDPMTIPTLSVSEPPTSSILPIHSVEPTCSTSSVCLSSDLNTNRTEYYPAAVYYSPSPPPPTSPPLVGADLHPAVPALNPACEVSPLALPCPPAGPHIDHCFFPPSYCAAPPACSADSDSSTATWASWRDDCDIAEDVIAVATGERPLSERMLARGTEYLPVPADIGLVDKRLLWA